MNIHLPAILMFTRGTIGFDPLPYNLRYGYSGISMYKIYMEVSEFQIF